jgi:dolichyl-phosphate beta-glucosyltransferase
MTAGRPGTGGANAGPGISRVSVIVPAFNEVATIEQTLGEIGAYFGTKPYDFEIIVAADGDDGTREHVGRMAALEPRLKVIGQRERRGKGFGIRQGVRLATGDVVGFVDADNKTPIQEFDKFESLLAAGCDVVIGSRALRESRVERPQRLYRRVGSRGFGVFMHAVVGLTHIVDTQCGFKFFRREAAVDLFSRQQVDGYMFDVEILDLANRAGYRLEQVPVRWHDDGDSRLQLVRGNLRNVADIVRIYLNRYRKTARA